MMLCVEPKIWIAGGHGWHRGIVNLKRADVISDAQDGHQVFVKYGDNSGVCIVANYAALAHFVETHARQPCFVRIDDDGNLQ